ncbi:MAG: hypothetical protein GX811_10465, partial [Lentisphaerae bacterium]|nr:hypothetical protein [Lentisphaerota bacterium]
SIIDGGVFYNLVVTNQGVHLEFVADSTNMILPNGSLTMLGPSESEQIKLRSSLPGVSWGFKVDPTANQNIWHVDVQDSDASMGAQVTSFMSQDSGNNQNWLFNNYPPGIVNRWTGSENNLWNNGANWHSGREPYPEDFILIPAGLSIYPTINAIGRTIAGIEIESGASLNLGGYFLTVNDYAKFHGSLICESDEILTISGDIDFSGGTFQRATSTMIVAGNSNQSFTPDELEFYKIIIENTDTVTFKSGFSVYRFLVEPPLNETRSIVFRSGKTVSIDYMSFLSPPGTRQITLRSSNQNNFWNLCVNEGYTIRGVDVRDSNAQSGLNLIVSGSLNSGNNVNWDFDQSWAEWTGAGGDSLFENAANWYPTSVPGADDMVRMSDGQFIRISDPVTIHTLTLGGGSQNVEMTAYAELTVLNDLYLLAKSTLALNRPSEIDGHLVVYPDSILTHSSNTAVESNKLNLVVAGDMTVFPNGIVSVQGKGYTSGYGPGGLSGVNGGSYGGRAGGQSITKPCYGSIIAPTNLGSGGGYGGGGGAIRMKITGQLINNGLISADSVTSGYPTGSGGSIWLIFASLCGNGTISANSVTASGGGGRISLISTETDYEFEEFAGIITAFGGRSGYGHGGGGTIYLESAIDREGHGRVIIRNPYAAYTALPAEYSDKKEASRASFFVEDNAYLRLTENWTVGDIWLISTNAVLDLNQNTLSVCTKPHTLLPGSVINYGEIIWHYPGTIFIFR